MDLYSCQPCISVSPASYAYVYQLFNLTQKSAESTELKIASQGGNENNIIVNQASHTGRGTLGGENPEHNFASMIQNHEVKMDYKDQDQYMDSKTDEVSILELGQSAMNSIFLTVCGVVKHPIRCSFQRLQNSKE